MHEKITLPNGVRIVFERAPHVRSASVGVWVGVGSRNESAKENGSSHFIEHMLFKGTDKYSAADLASLMDGIGGQINAYTTKESTCFYAKVLDTHLDTAIDLLRDMFIDSVISQEDVETERGVILEEIGMYDDSPEDVVVQRLFKKCFRGALGRPILGTAKTLGGMTGESLRLFKETHYTADRIVIAICGSFSDSHLRHIRESFEHIGPAKKPAPAKGIYSPCVTTKRRATEQNHICFGFPGLPVGDDMRFAMSLMSTILGGGMSSRLFQTVREKNGLCYSVCTFSTGFSDAGIFSVETALSQETEERALRLITDELRRIRDEAVSDEELKRAREQVKSNVVMSLESTSTRMNRLGNGELVMGYSLGADEVIERYDTVTKEDILAVSRRIFDFDRLSFSAVGRVKPADEYRIWNKA